jgi:hypothetical protein
MRKVSIRFTGKPSQANSLLHVRGTTLTDEAGHDIAQSLASDCAIFAPAHRLPQCSMRVDTRHLFPNDRGATPTPVLFHTTLLLPRATAIVKRRISLHTAEVGM